MKAKKYLRKLVPQSLANVLHYIEAVVAVLWYRYPARKLTVIGVTGTDGKTTTSNFIYQIIKSTGKKAALISTTGALMGKEKIEVGQHVTSPSPWLLQKIMYKATQSKVEYLVLEVTSHGLDQHRTWGSNIQYAVITNITHEHLDYHKHMSAYIQSKAKILRGIKVAVVNAQNSHVQELIKLSEKSITFVEFNSNNDSPYSKAIKNRYREFYNQENALAAALTCEQVGIEKSLIIAGVSHTHLVTGRMEYVPNNTSIEVVVDFAHTPNALEHALQALKSKTQGRLIAVYGSAGLRDAEKRPEMGRIGAQIADLVVLTCEDPRTENVESIIYQMKSQLIQHRKVVSIVDRQNAINFAIQKLAKAGDLVAILGKGHETSMNLDGIHETPWSDIEAATLALAGRKMSTKIPKVVILGGGTGTYVVGTGLTPYNLDLTAIVTVADNGGSTGRLRDEFGFQPVGDLRQALAAFSKGGESDDIRQLLLYRFTKGSGLEGHNLGNLILTALQDLKGSTTGAVETAAAVFRLGGKIYPITTKNIELVIEYEDGTVVVGESKLDERDYGGKKIIGIKTSPRARMYSKARQAIEEADFIIVGPGDLYGSIMPNLVVEGASKAIQQSGAKLIYNANLMSKFAQTHLMSISDHIKVIEDKINRSFDWVVINDKPIPDHILDSYAKEHESPLLDDVDPKKYQVIHADILAAYENQQTSSDTVKRSFIRHDSEMIAQIIVRMIIKL